MSIRLQGTRGRPRTRMILFLVGVALLWVTGRAAIKMYNKYALANAILEEKTAIYEDMKERGEFLEGELDLLSTPEGLEAEIRRKLSAAREGEEVVVIVDPNKNNKPIQPLREEPSWIGRILQFLNPFD
jgi:cell division protein FtsB